MWFFFIHSQLRPVWKTQQDDWIFFFFPLNYVSVEIVEGCELNNQSKPSGASTRLTVDKDGLSDDDFASDYVLPHDFCVFD